MKYNCDKMICRKSEYLFIFDRHRI
ncbi:hypothetical protein B4U79_04962, partial [Dinothrombium tinctorium]